MYNPADIIRYTMEMEPSNHNFYKENTEKTEGLMTEEILQRLMKTELSHYKYPKKLLKECEGASEVSSEVDMPKEEDIIFKIRKESEKLGAALEQSMIPDMNVLRIAYLIEEDFKQYYINMVEKAEDEKLKEILLEFAGWENDHTKLFKAQY